MGEPTLDDLRVTTFSEGGFSVNPGEGFTRPLTPAEFDRIATERGYVKRPVCGECDGDGKELDEASAKAVAAAVGIPVEELDNGPCDFCGGTGFGRLVALEWITNHPDAVTIPGHYWMDGKRIDDPTAALVVIPLTALEGGDTP